MLPAMTSGAIYDTRRPVGVGPAAAPGRVPGGPKIQDPGTPGFGIAGSARVGGSARRPSPPPGGCRPWGGGSDFFEKKIPKNGFLGDVCVEKIDFLGKLL